MTGTGGEAEAEGFVRLLCLNLGGSRGSAGISNMLIILSLEPELNATEADCCEGLYFINLEEYCCLAVMNLRFRIFSREALVS